MAGKFSQVWSPWQVWQNVSLRPCKNSVINEKDTCEDTVNTALAVWIEHSYRNAKVESLRRKLSTTVCLLHSKVWLVEFVLMTLQIAYSYKRKGKRAKIATLTAGHGWMTRIRVSKMHCCSVSSIPPPPVITLPCVWVDLVVGHHWYCSVLTKHVGHSPDIAGNVSLCDKPAVPICLRGV